MGKGRKFFAVFVAAAAVGPLSAFSAASVLAGPASAAAQCSGQVAGISAYSGTGQVAKVGDAFSSPLEAEVVDTGGCPVSDAPVTFLAPATGASGSFPGSVITVTVSTASNGIATAPALTANDVIGSFTVTASVEGSASATYSTDFDETNSTVGAVSTIGISSGNKQSAEVGTAFADPLAVSVLDSYGDPVSGTTVVFTAVADNGASATFQGGGSTATVVTDASGVATSPTLTAGTTPGAFTVTATVSGVTAQATFSLTNTAGVPYAITAGVGSSQSTELGSDFAVPLAVTVTDTNGNDVPGAQVVFSAPTSGASGVFAGSGTTAVAVTNSDGVATAPDFSANWHTGGYVVTATVSGVSSPATFGLVNEPRSGASAQGPDGSYWLLTSTGQLLTSGSAKDYGTVPAKLTSPAVAIAATPNFGGYWIVTANGTVYAFGDAHNYGSPASLHLAKPIVGIAATPDGKGYWLVASDGGLFNYGDAKYYGSPAKLHLAKPIVGVAATPDGKGYWLASSSGAIYPYGDAIAFGSGLGLLRGPVRAIVRTADGSGYWVVSANGTAAGFGDAGAQGSASLSSKSVVVSGAA
ncbi:MAG TPA: hypothetical protein VME20_10720 [Acidimicrobiales bacterium]|nr:hypothetical protein [Acidimicrobiales bacterium]